MGELHLIHGTDESLVGQAVVELVRRLVGAEDRSLMVADLAIDGEEITVGRLVAEAQTPPFLTEKRVVVARDANRLDADAVQALQAYLAQPLPTTDLVLVHQGKPAKKLLDAVKGAGGDRHRHGRRDQPAGPRRVRRGAGGRQRAAAQQRRAGRGDRPAGRGRQSPDGAARDAERDAPRRRRVRPAAGASKRWRRSWATPAGVPPWDLTDAIDARRPLDRAGRAGRG